MPSTRSRSARPTLRGFPANREQLKPHAQEVARLPGESAAQFRLAPAQYEAASQQAESPALADSWSLKAQAFQKFAESKEKDSFQTTVSCVLDETI